MTKTQHTKIIWTMDEDTGEIFEAFEGQENPLFVAHPECQFKTYQEWMKRARMAEAAPDLLDALEDLLAEITEYQTINNLGGENNRSQVKARAAIALARG